MKRLFVPLILAFAFVTASADAAKAPSIEQAKSLMASRSPGYVVKSCKRASGAVRCELYRDTNGWRYLRRGTWAANGRLTIGTPKRVCRVESRKGRCAFRLRAR